MSGIHLKMHLRGLTSNKTHSVINILGLSIGIAFSVLILLWVADELSFDRFHEHSGEIYRILGDDVLIGDMAATCGPLTAYMENNYPEVIRATRVMQYEGAAFKYGENMFNVDKGTLVDPEFLKMFSFRLLQGAPETALADLSSIVLTKSVAEKLFRDENPLGKTVLMDGTSPMNVSAVIDDPPENSQLQFNYLLNVEVLRFLGVPLDLWENAAFHTFIQVRPDADIAQLNAGIANLMGEQIPGFNRTLYLQPLTDIHLTNGVAYDLPGLGDKKYVYIFSAIALFLILIACINYINLYTARSLKKMRSVGLRKILGAGRFRVMGQFLSESAIISLVSIVVAAVIALLIIPIFNQISGKNLSLDVSAPSVIFGALLLWVVTSLLSGGYPALLMSRAKPLTVVNKRTIGSGGSVSRWILVVIQFSLAIMLLVGTITVYHQINYIRNKNLGFDKENIIYFSADGNFVQDYDRLKHELLSLSSITGVTAEDKMFMNFGNSTANLYWEGKTDQTDINIEYSHVDANFLDMLNVNLIAGRNFEQNRSDDLSTYILNEEAVDQMGLTDPVGKRFVLNGQEGRIIGVARNSNFKSLHHAVNPSVFMLLDPGRKVEFQYNGTIMVRTVPGKAPQAIASLQDLWRQENPDIPFEYHFLDETIDRQYSNEIRTGRIFSYFSLIAIFISCLGLYGLTMFMTEDRTKEIGIRKTIGASVPEILALLSADFTKWVLLANVVAWPVAWFAMHRWLQNFAYHVNMSWWTFALAGALALIIALFSISWQAIRAATANPVESLRYE